MSQTEEKIGQVIMEIATKANGGKLRFPVMTGTVVAGSVDIGELTCDVILSKDDTDTPTQGILISPVLESTNGLVLYPADNSQVWVAELDGPGKWGIVKYSDLTKATLKIGASSVTVTDGLVQFNDGSLGGLTKTLELQAQINKLNTLVGHLVGIINGIAVLEAGGGAASALQAALKVAILTDTVGDFSNIEDTTVKH